MQAISGCGTVPPHFSNQGSSLLCLENMPGHNGTRQSAAVHVLKFAANRNAMRDPAYSDTVFPRYACQIPCCRFTFNRRTGGENNFAHRTATDLPDKQIEAQFVRPDSVERRQTSL